MLDCWWAPAIADGPLAIVAGGPFQTRELVTRPEPDWSFVRDLQEVEFQLLDPPRSREGSRQHDLRRRGIPI